MLTGNAHVTKKATAQKHGTAEGTRIAGLATLQVKSVPACLNKGDARRQKRYCTKVGTAESTRISGLAALQVKPVSAAIVCLYE
jgi:hypothetical protein